MRRDALLVVLVLALAAPLWGQSVRYGGLYTGGYGGVAVGGGFSYSRGGLRIGGGFGGPVYGPPPFFRPYSQLTFVSVYTPPPVVVVQPPPIIIQVNGRGRDPELPPVPRVPPPPELPRLPDVKKLPAAKPAEKKPRPEPAESPEAEHARLVKEGREAFAEGAFGLAGRRFRAATELRPGEAEPYFLLAQALIAQGKYHDASAAVVAGLDKAPGWPASAFRPRDLYQDAKQLDEHAARLDEALRRHPGDSALLFLKGHLAWFAGRRQEAEEAFRRARPRFADKAAIERYLGAGKP